MPLPRFHTNGPYMGSFLSQPPSAALKRPRATSAPCENEEARHRKRSRADTAITFMNENILEEASSEGVTSCNAVTSKSKGKQKESLVSETCGVFGSVTAAVIEELAQVYTMFLAFYLSQYSSLFLSSQGAQMWMLYGTLL